MLEVKGIQNGIVIDHIKAGNGLKIFNKLLSEHIDTTSISIFSG